MDTIFVKSKTLADSLRTHFLIQRKRWDCLGRKGKSKSEKKEGEKNHFFLSLLWEESSKKMIRQKERKRRASRLVLFLFCCAFVFLFLALFFFIAAFFPTRHRHHNQQEEGEKGWQSRFHIGMGRDYFFRRRGWGGGGEGGGEGVGVSKGRGRGRGKEKDPNDKRDRECQRNGVLSWASAESLREGKYKGFPVLDEEGRCMRNVDGILSECTPLPENVIFSTYLTIDRSWGRAPEPNDSLYFSMWARKIQELGLVGVILHDDLDPNFVRNHTSDNLWFRVVTGHTSRSPNDRRFFLIRDILKVETSLKWVMMTDLRDVILARDPFVFADNQLVHPKVKLHPKMNALPLIRAREEWDREEEEGEEGEEGEEWVREERGRIEEWGEEEEERRGVGEEGGEGGEEGGAGVVRKEGDNIIIQPNWRKEEEREGEEEEGRREEGGERGQDSFIIQPNWGGEEEKEQKDVGNAKQRRERLKNILQRNNQTGEKPLVFVAHGDHRAFRSFQFQSCPGLDQFFSRQLIKDVLKGRHSTLLAAIWFAKRGILLDVLGKMCEIFEKLDPCLNCNTPLYNLLLYSLYKEEKIWLVGGAPYNTHRNHNRPDLVVYHMASPDNGPYSDWKSPTGSM